MSNEEVRDHLVSNEEVRDHLVSSEEVRDHLVSSEEVRDHLVSNEDVRDHLVSNEEVRDHLVSNEEVEERTKARLYGLWKEPSCSLQYEPPPESGASVTPPSPPSPPSHPSPPSPSANQTFRWPRAGRRRREGPKMNWHQTFSSPADDGVTLQDWHQTLDRDLQPANRQLSDAAGLAPDPRQRPPARQPTME